ncbi:MAG: alpha-amylase family protein [Chloroflexi bacterium]|nr:alpha-amylase family protein [Chloroflexota bacterium]
MANYWQIEGQKTFERLQPRLENIISDLPQEDQTKFWERLERQMPDILQTLVPLYGERYDFFYHLETILAAAAEYYLRRPAELKVLDVEREANTSWFQSEQMMGAVCYVDRFAGDLKHLAGKIPYFQELGITYLHLMPLFLSPEDNSDGGYAVSDYRQVDPALGTMGDLRELAHLFRENGISLVIDFVFNHTSDEHQWAEKARAGEDAYREYYFFFRDRTMPDAYEQNLREIFPEQAPGSFTYLKDIDMWVWTTFNTFQWDLNYSNPVVFREMLSEMLFLANVGVEIFRLDAVAFTWKRLGTNCENQPEAHLLIQAFFAIMQVVAPAVLFKSEAIVHPDDVVRYFGRGDRAGKECQISYNPMLMVLLWDALATRKVNLMNYALAKRFAIPDNCAWVNYVRVHDDIGWGFADEDAAMVGINGFDHRQFLNAFYTGRFEGTFARGLPFNYNPKTGDMRISGMAASLVGLEQALELGIAEYIEHAIRRHLLIHSIILSIGGIPLLYLNDEVATMNDYSYEDDPNIAQDNRWVHRPYTDWENNALRDIPGTIQHRVFSEIQRMIELRKSLPALAGNEMKLVNTHNGNIFGFVRSPDRVDKVMVLANFSEHPHFILKEVLIASGLSHKIDDLITPGSIDLKSEAVVMEPYQYRWITKVD